MSPDFINPPNTVKLTDFVETAPDTTRRFGGWLFRHRTWLPVPVALAIVTLRIGEAAPSTAWMAIGVLTTAAGELLRLWGVHHIGVISRTRTDRLGPLIDTGPFAYTRNPLYIGNLALWIGFAVTARLLWLAPVILLLLGLEYHAIVRWEERLLESRLGAAYRGYAARVPRWLPGRGARKDRKQRNDRKDGCAVSATSSFSARATLFSERGTLIAIAAGYVLLWIKLHTVNTR
jgi:protein-S-isoprenylcysteine O-methyltransferase Ste14